LNANTLDYRHPSLIICALPRDRSNSPKLGTDPDQLCSGFERERVEPDGACRAAQGRSAGIGALRLRMGGRNTRPKRKQVVGLAPVNEPFTFAGHCENRLADA